MRGATRSTACRGPGGVRLTLDVGGVGAEEDGAAVGVQPAHALDHIKVLGQVGPGGGHGGLAAEGQALQGGWRGAATRFLSCFLQG